MFKLSLKPISKMPPESLFDKIQHVLTSPSTKGIISDLNDFLDSMEAPTPQECLTFIKKESFRYNKFDYFKKGYTSGGYNQIGEFEICVDMNFEYVRLYLFCLLEFLRVHENLDAKFKVSPSAPAFPTLTLYIQTEPLELSNQKNIPSQPSNHTDEQVINGVWWIPSNPYLKLFTESPQDWRFFSAYCWQMGFLKGSATEIINGFSDGAGCVLQGHYSSLISAVQIESIDKNIQFLDESLDSGKLVFATPENDMSFIRLANYTKKYLK